MARAIIPCVAVALGALAVAGCGSGGSGGSGGSTAKAPAPAQTTQAMTWYDPETRLHPKEAGPVLVGGDGRPTATRHGLWTTWHPPSAGGAKQFEKTYVEGAWDRGRYWREWNADTSLRFDWRDR